MNPFLFAWEKCIEAEGPANIVMINISFMWMNRDKRKKFVFIFCTWMHSRITKYKGHYEAEEEQKTRISDVHFNYGMLWLTFFFFFLSAWWTSSQQTRIFEERVLKKNKMGRRICSVGCRVIIYIQYNTCTRMAWWGCRFFSTLGEAVLVIFVGGNNIPKVIR